MSHDDELDRQLAEEYDYSKWQSEQAHCREWYSEQERADDAVRKTFLTWLEGTARDGDPRSKLFLASVRLFGFNAGAIDDDAIPLVDITEASLWASQAAVAEDADVARLAKMIEARIAVWKTGPWP
jgi:hypothetical protein